MSFQVSIIGWVENAWFVPNDDNVVRLNNVILGSLNFYAIADVFDIVRKSVMA